MKNRIEDLICGVISLLISTAVFYGLLKLIQIMPFGDWFFEMIDRSMKNMLG